MTKEKFLDIIKRNPYCTTPICRYCICNTYEAKELATQQELKCIPNYNRLSACAERFIKLFYNIYGLSNTIKMVKVLYIKSNGEYPHKGYCNLLKEIKEICKKLELE